MASVAAYSPPHSEVRLHAWRYNVASKSAIEIVKERTQIERSYLPTLDKHMGYSPMSYEEQKRDFPTTATPPFQEEPPKYSYAQQAVEDGQSTVHNVQEHHHEGAASVDAQARSDGQRPSAEPERASKAKRKRISPEQLNILMSLFYETDTPSYEQREKLALKLAMSNREVQVWFQNRRAKERNAKQKQQLQEHRDRLEKAELNTGLSGIVQQSLHSSSLASVAQTSSVSSPAGAQIYSYPPEFDFGRRRSLSTSAIEMPDTHSHTSHSHASQAAQTTRPYPQLGPVRPRYPRPHSYNSPHGYTRPHSARTAVDVHLASGPLASPALENPFSGRLARDSRAHGLSLPLPSPRPTYTRQGSSYDEIASTSSSSSTIADRRHNRLPPIRMLLEIADRASAQLSPSLIGVSSVQSYQSLQSPFSDLNINTPGSQDCHRTEYFTSRDATHVTPDTTRSTYTFPPRQAQ